jgi:NAD(P)-dependent dehydrogenase (short-subunit alcohol dehydrogenase family)
VTSSIHAGGPGAIREPDPGRTCRRMGDKVVLLTAAARGIGFASAARLAAEGATVCITDRDEAALTEAAALAQACGIGLHGWVMDSSDPAMVAETIADILRRHDRIDILVNNAGGSLHTPYRFEEEEDDDWKRVLELNVMGAVWASKAVLPSMVKNGYGRIVNFGSKAGRFGSLIAGANYAAAKGAIASMTRQMAMEYGPHGITVNCICPGIVMTERTRGLWAQRRTPEERTKVLEEIPLRRHCEVEDIAAAVAFFASDDAGFVTGVTLDVNGGQGMA